LQWLSLEPQLSAEHEVLSVLRDVPEAFNLMKQVGLAVAILAIVLIFSFSYSCESFSAMNLIKSDIRNSYKIFSRYKTSVICHCLQQRSHIDFTKSPKHMKYALIVNNRERNKKCTWHARMFLFFKFKNIGTRSEKGSPPLH